MSLAQHENLLVPDNWTRPFSSPDLSVEDLNKRLACILISGVCGIEMVKQ